MSLIKLVVIHPQSEPDCIKYSNVVKSLIHDGTYKVVLFYKTEFTELIKFLYQDIRLYVQFEPEENYSVYNFQRKLYSSPNILKDLYKEHIVKGYGEFDKVRTDAYYNVFDTVWINRPLTYDNIVEELYPDDGFNPEFSITTPAGETRSNIVIIRNSGIETQMVKKLKNYFNMKFICISNDKFKKYVFNLEVNSINPFKLFPNNTNVYNFISLCTNANSFIVSNDDLGRLIYTLQTNRIVGNVILNNKIKVFVHLEGYADKLAFLTAHPFFDPPPESWKFGNYEVL
jgi:hypothetical protein